MLLIDLIPLSPMWKMSDSNSETSMVSVEIFLMEHMLLFSKIKKVLNGSFGFKTVPSNTTVLG